MKFINTSSIFFLLSVSNVFAGSVYDLKAGSHRYAGTLEELHGTVEFQFVDQAEKICGPGNVKKIFDIETKAFGDFEVLGRGHSIFSDNYPKMFASAKVECK